MPMLQKATWVVAVVFGEDEPWAQEATLKPMSRLKNELGRLPPTITGFGKNRLRLGGWASFIAKMVYSYSTDLRQTIADLALLSWMATK
ncbi:hypothetical protein FRC11_007839 [Ceratobasidium sp. 423]|nr:hypothetical protein FRC11_007839 [Ceratobasidium sp. 423]